MSISHWQSGSAALLALGTLAGTAAPLVLSVPASAQTSFSDVSSSYWAQPFIQVLASEGVISGFPDGTFKPDAPVTRAQFAAIVRQAFSEANARSVRTFSDVPSTYWAAPAIREAYETGFMSGYPDGTFQPEQQIPKVQVLVSLASGLRLSPSGSTSTALNVYSDASDVPSYATNGVAAATQKRIVVNYPNVRFLNPNETATRGDVAAYIYQALASSGRLKPLATNSAARQYIVGGTASATSGSGTTTGSSTAQGPQVRVPQNTSIAVKYPDPNFDTISVKREETVNNLVLRVAKDVKNSQGQVLIPEDSEIVGQLVPRYDSAKRFIGSQFVAQRLRIANQSYTINATSEIVTGSQPSADTAKDTAASQAVRGVINSILGGGQGTVSQSQDVLVIDPETDLSLTTRSDFYVRSAS